MLKGIPAAIPPELMKILMEMGHGDEIVLSDANFPSSSCAKRLVRCDGIGIVELLDALMIFFPLDYAVEEPVCIMSVTPVNSYKPEIWESYRACIEKYDKNTSFEFIDRFLFYERAKAAYAIVATGERARFANIILKKGIVSEDTKW